MTTCDGGDGCNGPVRPYIVRDHDGTESPVRYCDECAELAEADWNGNTAALTPVLDESDAFEVWTYQDLRARNVPEEQALAAARNALRFQ